MKKWLALYLCALLSGLLLSGCTVSETETPQKSVDTLPPVQTSTPEGQEGVFDALAGESILGVVILNPTQEELDLAEPVDRVFPPQEYGEYLLIVPKLPGSTITLQELTYDEESWEVVETTDVHTTSGTDPVAMLVQQDIPEGFPTLRVVVESDGRTGTYDVSYYGKGDGRRDFYIMWEREP